MNNTEDIQRDQQADLLQPQTFFLLPFFLKMNQFSVIFQKLEEHFLISPRQRNILQLVKLFLTIIIIAHLFASIWLFLAQVEIKYFNQDITSWVQFKEIDGKPWILQYIYALYYIIVTMVTVGYGDISPQNCLEMIVSIITIIFGCGVFGYSLNMVGIIFQEMFKIDNEIKKNLYIINNYMNKKKVNKDLQFQVRKYLEYFWVESSVQNQVEEDKIIGQLTSQLQDKLLFEANKMILKDSPIFFRNFTDGLLQKIVPLIKEYRTIPEEVLYLKDELDDQCIYFIEKGLVELYFEFTPNRQEQSQNCLIKQIQKGQSFGYYSFFTGNQRLQCARSVDFCTLLVIKRSEFLELLKDFPLDYERFCDIKDNISLKNNFDLIKMKCFSCKSAKHDINHCPLLHFTPNKRKIITIHCRSVFQDRNNFYKRQRKSKLNSLINHRFNLAMIKNFKNNEEDIIQSYYENQQQQYKLLHNVIGSQNNISQQYLSFTKSFESNNEEDCIRSQKSQTSIDSQDSDELENKQPSQKNINQQQQQQNGMCSPKEQTIKSENSNEQINFINLHLESPQQSDYSEHQLGDEKEVNCLQFTKKKSFQGGGAIDNVFNNMPDKLSKEINSSSDSIFTEHTNGNSNDNQQPQLVRHEAKKLSYKSKRKVSQKKQKLNYIQMLEQQQHQQQQHMQYQQQLSPQQQYQIRQQLEGDQNYQKTLLQQQSLGTSNQKQLNQQKKNANRQKEIFLQKNKDANIVDNPFSSQATVFQQKQLDSIQQITESEFLEKFETVYNFAIFKPWNNISFIERTQKMDKQQIIKECNAVIKKCEQKLGIQPYIDNTMLNLDESQDPRQSKPSLITNRNSNKRVTGTNNAKQSSKFIVLSKKKLTVLQNQQLQQKLNNQQLKQENTQNNQNIDVINESSGIKDQSILNLNQSLPLQHTSNFIQKNNNTDDDIRFGQMEEQLNDEENKYEGQYKLKNIKILETRRHSSKTKTDKNQITLN